MKQIFSFLKPKKKEVQPKIEIHAPAIEVKMSKAPSDTTKGAVQEETGTSTPSKESPKETSLPKEDFDSKVEQVSVEHIAKVNNLPPNLPEDILKLAAVNQAFLQGVKALQKMGLDDDIFFSAVQDLRKKYDNVREPLHKPQSKPKDKDESEQPQKLLNS